MYVDMHTHQQSKDGNVWRLNSLSLSDLEKDLSLDQIKNPFTVGVHPWECEHYKAKDFKNLWLPYVDSSLCLGLGEMGLDKARKNNYSEQLKIFKQQVHWANDLGVKFLVIHCVRAQNDILKIFKDLNYSGRALFHDFNGSHEELRQLFDHGHLISLGPKIFDPKTKAHKRLQSSFLDHEKIPWSSLFLETDDSSESIESLYEKLSQISEIPVEDLKEGFWNALESLFY